MPSKYDAFTFVINAFSASISSCVSAGTIMLNVFEAAIFVSFLVIAKVTVASADSLPTDGRIISTLAALLTSGVITTFGLSVVIMTGVSFPSIPKSLVVGNCISFKTSVFPFSSAAKALPVTASVRPTFPKPVFSLSSRSFWILAASAASIALTVTG